MDEVAEYLHAQPGLNRVPDQPGQLRVQGRLPADELHRTDPHPGSLINQPFPVQRRHRPVRA
jgi:hypothetical protein